MGDLVGPAADLPVGITGLTTGGVPTTPVASDVNGNLLVKPYSDGPVTPGTVAASSNLAGGQYNTTLPTPTNTQQTALQTDLNGRLIVAAAPLDGYKATYAASVVALATAATATDIFTITGSATKTIRVVRIRLSANQSNQGWQDILLIKRSTANTAGTSTSRTAVPFDSTSAAATATVLAYTANPTLGTAVGTMRAQKLYIPLTSSGGNQVGAIDYLEWMFGTGPMQTVVLRGTSQVLAINLNSITLAGSNFDIDIEWTEES